MAKRSADIRKKLPEGSFFMLLFQQSKYSFFFAVAY